MEALMEFIKGTGGILVAAGIVIFIGVIALIIKCYRNHACKDTDALAIFHNCIPVLLVIQLELDLVESLHFVVLHHSHPFYHYHLLSLHSL